MKIVSPKAYKEAIKLLMKKQKIKYDQLANHLGISLPSIKRILNQEEIGLHRLLKICELLKVNLSELETLALNSIESQHNHLTEDQELFLASNHKFMTFYFLLFDLKAEDIKKKYHLNNRSYDKYILKLEKNGLITTQQNGSIKTTLSSQPAWTPKGPLALAYSKQIFSSYNKFLEKKLEENLLLYSQNKEVDDPISIGVWQMDISESSLKTWKEGQKKHLEELVRLSKFEEKFLEKDQLVSFAFLQSDLIFKSEKESFQAFNDSFGVISNFID